MIISSWGRLERKPHQVFEAVNNEELSKIMTKHHPGIAYGMGRSYGDVCLNPNGVLWKGEKLDRFIDFDEENGRLTCGAGVILRDINRLFVPKGYMLSVTPGTQWVTVGGAIANDIHGKNHHQMGSFGHHLHRIRLLRTNGEIVECGPSDNSDWFTATVGGMGLTGFILDAEIQLRKIDGPWIAHEKIPFHDLDTFFELSLASQKDWEHTVAWVDCLSFKSVRGIFSRGNFVSNDKQDVFERRRFVMPKVPFSLVNQKTLSLFNSIYFYSNRRQRRAVLSPYESFLYPLDRIYEWNRMYGPKGFYQYQTVIPLATGKDAVNEMLRAIQKAHSGSFLTVLKVFGSKPSLGLMSFPMEGVTLALDFPNKGEKVHRLFERLDDIVKEAGGRIYLAKDARMPKALLESGYCQVSKFLEYRDPHISSAMSRRLLGS